MKNVIYPELGEKTEAQITFTVSYRGGYYLTTALDLSGRGIKLSGDGSDHARNLKTYHATDLALEKLKKVYTACYIALL
jgi:hypothetical protein